jgi:hypothetical protein
MSERVPIRGPEAEQRRQPQRVQPGGFFRPLFGRSKRGHFDGYYQEDRCSKAGGRTRIFACSRGQALLIPSRIPTVFSPTIDGRRIVSGDVGRSIIILKNCTAPVPKTKKPAPAIAEAGGRW